MLTLLACFLQFVHGGAFKRYRPREYHFGNIDDPKWDNIPPTQCGITWMRAAAFSNNGPHNDHWCSQRTGVGEWARCAKDFPPMHWFSGSNVECNCDPCSYDYDFCDWQEVKMYGVGTASSKECYQINSEYGDCLNFPLSSDRCRSQCTVVTGKERQWTCGDSRDMNPSCWKSDWDCGNQAGYLNRATGKVSDGRRREESTYSAADEELCIALTDHASQSEYMTKLFEALENGDSALREESSLGLAKEVITWCDDNVSEASRRRSDSFSDHENLERHRKQTLAEWEPWRFRFGSNNATNIKDRRRSVEEDLPMDMHYQCRGYAWATVQLIAKTAEESGPSQELGANTFIMNANSDNADDRKAACGSIVNYINAATLSDTEMEDVLYVNPDIVAPTIAESDVDLDGSEEFPDAGPWLSEATDLYGPMVVTTNTALGESWGMHPMSVVIAGVVQTVYALFAICKSYQELAHIA